MTILHAVLVTPLSGSLSLYGKAGATALALWARRAAQLPAPWREVELAVHDSSDDLHAVLSTALQRHPDVLFGPYGSGPMLSMARSCSRLIWNHGGASSRLARPAFPQVMNILSPASSYFAGVLQAIHASDPTARTISLVHSTTGFGRDVAAGAKREAECLGMTLHAVAFEPAHALEVVERVPEADILLVAGNFADEGALAPELLSRSWRFRAFVGAGVEEVLASLGPLREGLLGPAQWVAHTALPPDEGPDATWFVTCYHEEAGTDPPYAAAQAFAAGILYARCLRETGDSGEEMIQAAVKKLECHTLFGAFRLDPKTGLQTGHEVVIVQWQHGQRRVVWPPEQAEAPVLPSLPTSWFNIPEM
jgi:branched-chain amino acid transport system substrate-binding protein